MYVNVHLRIQCSDPFSELFVDDVEHAGPTSESVVGTTLLEVFDTVHVENVTVQPSSERNNEDEVRG